MLFVAPFIMFLKNEKALIEKSLKKVQKVLAKVFDKLYNEKALRISV